MEPILLIPKTISANRVAYWEPHPRPCHKERKELFPKHLSQIIEHVCVTHVPATSQSIFYGGLCLLWDGFYSRFLCMPQNVKDFNNANSMLWHWTSFCPSQPNNPYPTEGALFPLQVFSTRISVQCAALTTIVTSVNNGTWGYVNQMSMRLGILKKHCCWVSSKTRAYGYFEKLKVMFINLLKIVLVIWANAQIICVNFTASSGCYLILILIVITAQQELN